jgi:hypothetical protein
MNLRVAAGYPLSVSKSEHFGNGPFQFRGGARGDHPQYSPQRRLQMKDKCTASHAFCSPPSELLVMKAIWKDTVIGRPASALGFSDSSSRL